MNLFSMLWDCHNEKRRVMHARINMNLIFANRLKIFWTAGYSQLVLEILTLPPLRTKMEVFCPALIRGRRMAWHGAH